LAILSAILLAIILAILLAILFPNKAEKFQRRYSMVNLIHDNSVFESQNVSHPKSHRHIRPVVFSHMVLSVTSGGFNSDSKIVTVSAISLRGLL
jgi:hypothetical protein